MVLFHLTLGHVRYSTAQYALQQQLSVQSENTNHSSNSLSNSTNNNSNNNYNNILCRVCFAVNNQNLYQLIFMTVEVLRGNMKHWQESTVQPTVSTRPTPEYPGLRAYI